MSALLLGGCSFFSAEELSICEAKVEVDDDGAVEITVYSQTGKSEDHKEVENILP